MNERIKELWEEGTTVDVPCEGKYSPVSRSNIEKFVELLLEKFSYDLMNNHVADPERIVYVAKHYGVDL